MRKPTKKQIAEEIKTLGEIKPKVPARTFFGDSNWEAIDAQIVTMELNYSTDTIYNRHNDEEPEEGEWTAHERDSALDARRWLDGETADKPSKDWRVLIKT